MIRKAIRVGSDANAADLFTIVFDLEETLTCVKENDEGKPDGWMSVIKSESKQRMKLGIYYRPFLTDCLKRLKALGCELIVWSSGATEYANKLISSIDKENEIFDMRLFKDNCYITSKGLCIKDIRIINRPLHKCIIVDNHAYSFGFQLENGVLVLPFTADSTDTEMLTLTEYLIYLMSLEDFRPFNKKHFKYEVYEKESTFEGLTKKLLKS